MKPSHPFLICLLFASSIGAVWDSVAVKKVREGIRLFTEGEYVAAGEAFDAADSAEPDNETVTFDRACALTAQGELDQATNLFQQAALAPAARLSSAAHYNIGNLAAAKAKETLGDDPVNVDPGKREEAISDLLTAVGHYRDCLRMDSTHALARHNLELIRLFVKHMQAEWEQRDREKAREELGLLEFLAMIEQQQHGLRTVAELLDGEDDSPQRRQTLRDTADSQRQLQEEIDPLKQKLAAELQPHSGQQSPNAGDEQLQQIQTLLLQLADGAGEVMLKAADQVQAADLKPAQQTQQEALDQLNEVFMVVAPFAKVLERSIPVQEGLVQKSESIIASSGSPPSVESQEDPDVNGALPPEAGAAAPQRIDSDEAAELSWKQSRISDWGRLLGLRAEAELPQAEAQIEAMAAQAPEEPTPSTDDDPVEEAPPADPTAQLKALVESLRKAIELAPQIEQHSALAESHLASADVNLAVPDQHEALRLLKEIAKPLSDQKDQDKKQPDEKDERDQKQDSQDQNESQKDQQDEQSGKDDQQEQQQKSSEERANSVLRRAREREQEHRDLEKELKRILGGLIKVDKDW